jgi:tellurite resistance protein
MTRESARPSRGDLSPNTSVGNARDNMYVAALVVMVAVAIAIAEGLYVGVHFGRLAQS